MSKCLVSGLLALGLSFLAAFLFLLCCVLVGSKRREEAAEKVSEGFLRHGETKGNG